LLLFIFTGTGKMQMCVPILHPDRNKFSKIPDTKTKTKNKNITADIHFITTAKKALGITAPCQKRGDSGNLKFCAFYYLCRGLTVLFSESPAFGKLQTVSSQL
jgi:hypothetical protein